MDYACELVTHPFIHLSIIWTCFFFIKGGNTLRPLSLGQACSNTATWFTTWFGRPFKLQIDASLFDEVALLALFFFCGKFGVLHRDLSPFYPKNLSIHSWTPVNAFTFIHYIIHSLVFQPLLTRSCLATHIAHKHCVLATYVSDAKSPV